MPMHETFTYEEMAILLELLREEADELPVEIHHCRTTEMRDRLRHRLEVVQRMLERLEVPAGARI